MAEEKMLANRLRNWAAVHRNREQGVPVPAAPDTILDEAADAVARLDSLLSGLREVIETLRAEAKEGMAGNRHDWPEAEVQDEAADRLQAIIDRASDQGEGDG